MKGVCSLSVFLFYSHYKQNILFSCLTEKQRQVYILFHIKGYKKVQIAAMLHIDERSVRRRLEWAQKRISK
ncbi:MAG TPA: hypothetical protein H9729_06250, partial [Candidatus Borkfalkia excrementigallinarum]|nr:hypothetical protein [Candidatus Borkfalkia excrementigallinarum]